jgi:hypothetical protein
LGVAGGRTKTTPPLSGAPRHKGSTAPNRIWGPVLVAAVRQISRDRFAGRQSPQQILPSPSPDSIAYNTYILFENFQTSSWFKWSASLIASATIVKVGLAYPDVGNTEELAT